MKRLPQKLLPALTLILTGQVYFARLANACPTCKDGMHDATAMAFAISILFMMAMPFVIFAFWVVTILRLRARMEPVEDQLVTQQL